MNTKFWNQLLLTPVVGLALIAAPAAMAAGKVSVQASDLQAAGTTELKASATIAPIELAAAPIETLAPEAAALVAPIETAAPAPVAPLAVIPAAAPAAVQISQAAPAAARPTGEVLNEVNQYSSGSMGQVTSAGSMGQVTSITQLSDVQPTDWAYQALQSLVERYGCIAGYPDGTYKGQRAMTRFEFAAGMNACLDRISELIAASTADFATKEDLATLQRLQEEFAAELAALRGRVDALEARTSELEANQFSTTTKLSGESVFGVAGLFGGGVENESLQENNNVIASGRTRLTFDTSFSGNDLLRARLQAGNFGRFNTTDSGGSRALGSDGRLGFDTDTDNSVELDILTYQFKVGPVAAIIAAQAPDFNDLGFFTTVSPFASAGRGAISRFGRFNPIYRTAGGTGAGLGVDFDFASLKVAYLAGGANPNEAGSPNPGSGLFNGDYGVLAQAALKPLKDLTIAFTYANTYSGSVENDDGTFSANGFNTGTGSNRSRLRVGDQPVIANSYGAEVNYRVAKFLQIGGWFTYSAVRVIETGDAQVWNYAGTIGFPDLLKKGSLLGFVVGVQPYLGGTSGFDVSGGRQDNTNGLHVESFYRFQLNDNISITPGLIWLTAPNHDQDNDDVFIGAIRTTFTF